MKAVRGMSIGSRLKNAGYVIAHCTSQFLCQASEDGCGVSVFSRVESILSSYSRTQTQQVGEFLQSILGRENGVQ